MQQPLSPTLLDTMATQLSPVAFHALLTALPDELRPPPGDPGWLRWFGWMLCREDGPPPVSVMDWMERQCPEAFTHNHGQTDPMGTQMAQCCFRTGTLPLEQQHSLAWLIRRGFLEGVFSPSYPMTHALENEWWPVAEALAATARPGHGASLAEVLAHRTAQIRLQTPGAWEWVLNQCVDLHALVDLEEVANTPSAAVGPQGAVLPCPQVPLWMKLALHGLDAAGEWGVGGSARKHTELQAWACAAKWHGADRHEHRIATLLRQHPDGLQGRRPGTGVPEAWLAISRHPGVLDRLTDAEVASIPATPSGQGLWFALAHQEGGLSVGRARRLQGLVELTVDGLGRGLITGGGLHRLTHWPKTLKAKFKQNPELAWGTADSVESGAWARRHTASHGQYLHGSQRNPVWEAALLHPRPEDATPTVRGLWVLAVLSAKALGPATPGCTAALSRWLEAGIDWNWVQDLIHLPPSDDGGALPTTAEELKLHPCWPMVRSHWQSKGIQATCPAPVAALPVRPRM